MTPKRPQSLKWIGERYPDGRPAHFLDFVPDRDLDEAETDALTQEQLADIRTSGLYREVHPPEKKKKTATKAAKTTTSRPDGAERVIGAATTSETSAAETSATAGDSAAESEG